MPTFAAVDIGANSVRLKVASLSRNRLHVIEEDREVTRLGEAVFRSGALDPQAMARTVKVLRRFHRTAQSHGADLVRVVATSALRDARNAGAFREWVRAATGWRVEVVSGLEEGRLIHLGVMSGARIGASRMLLVDLGGGSCELTISVDGQIRQLFSLPLGAVRLTQEFLQRDPPKKKEVARLREFIVEEIGPLQKRIAGKNLQVAIATSGTAAALAANWASRQEKHKRAPRTVPTAALRTIAAELQEYTVEQRATMPGIGTRRAEIIVAGAVVFAELFGRLGFPSFRYSPLGLRDGLLAQMVADYGRSRRIRKQIQSERWNALLQAARHYRVDLRHAERVRHLVSQLFTRLKTLHRLPPEYLEWLTASAMLYEVGGYLNRSGRSRHSYYIVAHSEIFGYTVEQRHLIATIARYMGGSRPTPTDRLIGSLKPNDRDRVAKAIVLLRIAAALDQGRRGAIRSLTSQTKDGRVQLSLKAARSGGDLELWALEKECGYFREVFGRELLARLS